MSATPSAPSPTDNAPVEVDPLLGRVINDRYRVTEQIGQGGMGRVYKALQSPLDRVVALKVLGAGHDRDPNFYKRFFLEASVTAKLTHPNSITLYDYGRTEDGIFFIAMEFLNGRTLSATMQSDGALAQERVVHIAQGVCRSLREAHSLGIIHRDLKPANVMLLRQHDDHDFVKVLDFGLVKFFSDGQDSDLTNAGTFMGSPHYIAPEQARNQNPDQRCDIYSLGVLIYHMITGKVPFTAPNPVDIILKHLHDVPVPPSQLRPDLNLSPALEELVLKCMAKERESRYQSMDEVLLALRHARTQITGVSGPMSMPPGPPQEGINAPSASFAAPTPSISMRTPSGALSQPPPPPAEDAPVESVASVASFGSPVEGTSRTGLWIGLLVAAAAVGGFFVLRAGRTTTEPAPAEISGAVVSGSARPATPAAAATARPGSPATGQTGTAAAAPANVAKAAPATDAAAAPASTPGAPAFTVVSLTSSPAGAEVHDEEDHVLGTTPLTLRLANAKPVVLTLSHEGYKSLTVKHALSGEKAELREILKKDVKAASNSKPGKRPVGYKDDPY